MKQFNAAWHDNVQLTHSFETKVMLKYYKYYSKARPNLFQLTHRHKNVNQ